MPRHENQLATRWVVVLVVVVATTEEVESTAIALPKKADSDTLGEFKGDNVSIVARLVEPDKARQFTFYHDCEEVGLSVLSFVPVIVADDCRMDAVKTLHRKAGVLLDLPRGNKIFGGIKPPIHPRPVRRYGFDQLYHDFLNIHRDFKEQFTFHTRTSLSVCRTCYNINRLPKLARNIKPCHGKIESISIHTHQTPNERTRSLGEGGSLQVYKSFKLL